MALEFIENKVLPDLHFDRDLASLLLPKLLKGCDRFLEMYDNTVTEETQDLNLY